MPILGVGAPFRGNHGFLVSACKKGLSINIFLQFSLIKCIIERKAIVLSNSGFLNCLQWRIQDFREVEAATL